MSKNPLILSYNKNEEIEELAPASSPSISSSDSIDKNDLIYHSYFILPQMSIKDNNTLNKIQNLKSSNKLFKSFSGSPLIFNNEPKKNSNKRIIYNAKTQKLIWKKEPNNNNIKINKTKQFNNKTEKKPRKKKLLNSYNSCKNIYDNKKIIDNEKNVIKPISNKLKKIKTISLGKTEEKMPKKEISNGNITVKNDNVENRIEFDRENKKINIYIKNNIYNYNLINEIKNNNKENENFIESQNSVSKSEIKIPTHEYFIKSNNINLKNNFNNNTQKKNNVKKPSIKLSPTDNNNNTFNAFNTNKLKFDFPFPGLNSIIQKPIKIFNSKNSIKINLISKLYELYTKNKHKKNKPILNILSCLNQKDLIEIINIRNKKLMLILNKTLIDSYFINIKKNLKKYSHFLEPIKSTLVYTYSKIRSSLKIDIMCSIRFIDKKNKISPQNPKHFQLLYLFDYLKDKTLVKEGKNKNRLYDCYGFDIIPENIFIENKSKKEFKGIYLNKSMSRFNIDKNDELICVQPILPFKFNDKGIFNFEIFSNQNLFINPRSLRLKLNIIDIFSNSKLNELRINEYETICKYWKINGGLNEKTIERYKEIIKEWFDKLFLVKDIFYADIGLLVFKFNLVANHCGILRNPNLKIKLIIKEKDEYVENEIKKNNLLFERNNALEIRKGENLIFYISMY